MNLVDAALLDQERRILEAKPLEIAGSRGPRIKRPFCDKGCGRQLRLGRNEVLKRITCKSCLVEGR